ncbi:MAG TPA: ABC transporter substrate-binding protein [Candidatus Acidoferrales bacterium]|nr:ABC transporter substrate-binding protein [Candidatus Acidoferrales bacterium]
MPTNLDPRIGTDGQSERIDGLIFNSLVELDSRRMPHGDLAETWETPDPVTYVFHLRGGVKFHDGRPLTSADVKYTFDSILNGTVTTPKRGSLRLVKSIDTPDAATVIFRLSEPNGGFLTDICRPAFGVVPAGTGNDAAEHPIGTGPFRFVSAQQDDDVVLERNAAYFQTPAKIEQVRFRVVPEAVVRALELRKGSADLEMSSLAPDMIPVLRQQPSLDVSEQPGTNYAYVAINFDNPVLARKEVRQALALATNREEIIRYLYRGQARLADGPLPPNSWAYESDIAHFGFDPQHADLLLDSAGYPRRPENDGMRIKLTLKTSTEEISRLLGAVLKEQWRKVGVDLELESMETATLGSQIARGDFELYTLRWLGVNSDPEFYEFAFSSKRMPPMGGNRGHYRNPEVDALLDQARVESDREKRRELFSKIQKIIAVDLPYLSLWFMDNVSVHRKRISNVQISPSGDYDFLRSIEAR